jgi:hypothetical protein
LVQIREAVDHKIKAASVSPCAPLQLEEQATKFGFIGGRLIRAFASE